MSTVQLFGYLRHDWRLKAHEVATATDEDIAAAVTWAAEDFRDDPEWPCVAIGHITVERIPTQEFVASQVRSLKQRQQNIRADAEIKANAIEQQIQSLLAITYTEA